MIYQSKARVSYKIWTHTLIIISFGMYFFPMIAIANEKQDLIAGAKKEGEVMYYVAMPQDQITTLFRKFNEKYPFIKPKFYYAPTNVLITKILGEHRMGRLQADVIQLNSVLADVVRQNGVMDNYVSPELEGYPKQLKDPEGFWGSTYIQLNVIAYNTRLVKGGDIPKSYEELLEPKWKGKMGLARMSVKWFIPELQIMGEEKGLNLMRKLAAQKIKIFGTNKLCEQMLAAGEVSVCVNTTSDGIEKMKSDGANVEWVGVNPVPTAIVTIFKAKGAPHPNSAKLFVDFMLSKEGQGIIKSFMRIPGRQDISPDQANRKITYFIEKQESPERFNELSKMFNNIFLGKDK